MKRGPVGPGPAEGDAETAEATTSDTTSVPPMSTSKWSTVKRLARPSRMPIDPYILLLLGTVGLAALLPARGTAAHVASGASTAAIAFLFFLYGARLSTREALGWSVSDESMHATLNPTVDHGLVEVQGTFRGDTIVGTWRFTSDPCCATGTFSVRKTSAR